MVTVNVPPLSGPNTGKTGFAEVIVSRPNNTILMKLFGKRALTVAARAVAGPSFNSACIFSTGTTGTGISLNGTNSVLSAADCSIYDNSSSSTALTLSGGSSIVAKTIGLVGGYSPSNANISPTPTQVTTFHDPLNFLLDPAIPSSCTAVISSTGTYSPGCYSSVSVSGNASVIFSPGLYIINGNFSVNSQNVTMSGSDVTFYVTGGTKFQGGTSSTNLTAPTSGIYNGILFFQSRSSTQQFQFAGGAGGTILGIIYVPNGNLQLSGGSSGSLNVDLVAQSITIGGGSTLGNYSNFNGASVLAMPVMAE